MTLKLDKRADIQHCFRKISGFPPFKGTNLDLFEVFDQILNLHPIATQSEISHLEASKKFFFGLKIKRKNLFALKCSFFCAARTLRKETFQGVKEDCTTLALAKYSSATKAQNYD